MTIITRVPVFLMLQLFLTRILSFSFQAETFALHKLHKSFWKHREKSFVVDRLKRRLRLCGFTANSTSTDVEQ